MRRVLYGGYSTMVSAPDCGSGHRGSIPRTRPANSVANRLDSVGQRRGRGGVPVDPRSLLPAR